MLDLLSPPPAARDRTRLEIIKAIMAKPDTQQQLRRRTGYSAATISGVVRKLHEDGLVELVGASELNKEVRLLPLDGVAVGVEVGFSNIAVVARRAHQSHSDARWGSSQVSAAPGEAAWLDSAVALIREVVEEVGQGPEDIGTVGMGIPRMIDPKTQRFAPPVLAPWQDGEDPAATLAGRLTRRAGKERAGMWKVRLDNDANLGAYAASVYQYPLKETLIYIKASTGIGAGIVIGGNVFRGARGCAGEIGHTPVQQNGRYCLCGGRGCLETVIGADAMLQNVKTHLGGRPFEAPRSIRELIRSAKDGNPICSRVLREAAEQLGHSLGGLCNLLNPEVIVLGGAFGRAGAIAREACESGIRRTAMAAVVDGLTVASSEMEHSSAHGALLMGIDGEGL
ncbi:hypothetical protein BKM31_05995 [[Actinomadura] parvosata subsp. kistnae]|uniref:HTH marR-type domain-containing protein n=1 Tax=[Actinomadura] parvosata subsp. kistnae TaxID=1909395 RepID=A0A1V0AIZ0_9ACTN|nr:ROK family transcriptional regulator [Nonomuraea sp. ATCC 55076]AQZ70165.1 hypothetical protein BKM31_05995 [Nonomuraea sp. ATCC 55076]